MKKIRSIIRKIFRLFFGDFSGAQVFLYPMTLFWWIERESLVRAITSLLSKQRYQIPLFIFFNLFLFIGFLIVKNSSSILNEDKPNTRVQKRSFFAMVIEVHKTLLLTLIGICLIYVVGVFIKTYYAITIPVGKIYPLVLQGFCLFLILYYTIKNYWTLPYREDGASWDKSNRILKREFKQKPWNFISLGFTSLFLILAGCYVFNLITMGLLYTLIDYGNILPKLVLLEPVGIASLLYDVLILGVAFFLSNVLFSPVVIVVSHINRWFHPILLQQRKSQNEE
jgi:hypothetical protein